jgi:hypothetical protein
MQHRGGYARALRSSSMSSAWVRASSLKLPRKLEVTVKLFGF